MESHARGDARRVELAEEHVSRCMQRLRSAALALDRVLAERGDEDGRRRWVEPALRLIANVREAGPMSARPAGSWLARALLVHQPGHVIRACRKRSMTDVAVARASASIASDACLISRHDSPVLVESLFRVWPTSRRLDCKSLS